MGGVGLTKDVFRKHVLICSVLNVIAVAIIIGFCVIMFNRYSFPNEENTSEISGTVTEVYHGVPKGEFGVAMSNGDSLRLVYPWGIRNLYSTLGYDIAQLSDLLEGKNIECIRMNTLPWAVKIYVDDIVIDNSKLTSDAIFVTRIGIVIIGLMMLAFLIGGDILYLKLKYRCFEKAEKKRMRKIRRENM